MKKTAQCIGRFSFGKREVKYMDISIVLLLVFAVIMANLPFVSRKLFFFVPVKWQRNQFKHLGWCLLEWSFSFVVTAGIAYILESKQGQIFVQHWQFYATNLCLFLVFAYPGFIYRFLWHHKKIKSSEFLSSTS